MCRIMTTLLLKQDRTKLSGFTFIELMVVLMIIATMMTIALPYASRSSNSLQVKQDSLNIAEAAKYISDLAMDTKKPTRMVINPKTNSFILEVTTDISNQDFKSLMDFGSSPHYLGQNVQIINIEGFVVEGDISCLIFDPTKPLPTGSISLSTNDSIKTINIKGKQIEIEESTI